MKTKSEPSGVLDRAAWRALDAHDRPGAVWLWLQAAQVATHPSAAEVCLDMAEAVIDQIREEHTQPAVVAPPCVTVTRRCPRCDQAFSACSLPVVIDALMEHDRVVHAAQESIA